VSAIDGVSGVPARRRVAGSATSDRSIALRTTLKAM
jgi:hypothetical protein